MQNINGSLSVMSVADIIQWADNNKRSGTLVLSQGANQKKFYIQDGDIVYIWSNCDGDRFLNILENQLLIGHDDLNKAFIDSKLFGLPFVSYLLSERFFSREYYEDILGRSAETVLLSALGWDTGLFEFVGELPEPLQDSPVRLSSFQLLLEAMRLFDETGRSGRVDARSVMDIIQQHISRDDFDLPPIPHVMQQLADKISDPDISIDEIIACITDQILVTKILKICNSPYYGRIGAVSTLKEAVVIIGLKSLFSIVTVHAMSRFSLRNEKEIKKVLQHSLVCGMIARQITRDIRGNSELAFICGLLHDIGKTILLDKVSDYKLQPAEQEMLINENHAEVGYLLAKKWNFGDDIKAVIRYHHSPEQAGGYAELAEVIGLADAMAHLNARSEAINDMNFNRLDLCQLNIDDMLEKIELFDHEAVEIMDLM